MTISLRIDMTVEKPKKGNVKQCDCWRGMCVLPAITKIIAKIILKIIQDHLYSTINREQAGIRSEALCIDHINTLRLIIEQSAEYHSDLHLVLVHFEKAFDSVDRACIWVALRRCGVPEKPNLDKCCVLHGGTLSSSFEVKCGVRQGCILSPLLFFVVVGDIINSIIAHFNNSEIRCTIEHLSSTP